MKTSLPQFELMLTFMEQHGDLSKPSSNARGKINNLNKWEELGHLLNSSGSGDTKTTEKWKKVWADFKNNTKKKAARLHRSASGTGGGPALHTKLSDLEQRVLNLIGMQVATGLGVGEAGLSQMSEILIPTSQPNVFIESQQHDIEPVSLVEISVTRAQSSPPNTLLVEEVQRPQLCDEPGPSTSSVVLAGPPNVNVVVTQDDEHELSPIRLAPQSNVILTEPVRSGPTTPRRARNRRTPRRMTRPAHTDTAAQNFLQAEEFWREFKLQQHKDNITLRSEQNRIREMEVQTQREWQAIATRVLDMLDRLVNRFCNNN